MTMTPYLLTLSPRTAFGDAIFGDTLFGQVCWALAHRLGDDALSRLLQGYTQGTPFAVIGNAFPAGYFPRPHLPASYQATITDATQRKAAKKKVWLSRADMATTDQPLNQAMERLVHGADDLSQQKDKPWTTLTQQTHNSIHRLTGTTGDGGFAPYQTEQRWFAEDTRLEIVCLLDENKLAVDPLKQAFEDIALTGYGRDASIGLGKFEIISFEPVSLPHHPQATHYLTLGQVAPQGLGFDAQHSYYKPFVRFGRHGSMAVAGGKPFKAPVLLTQAGSVFASHDMSKDMIGQGLGGEGQPLSHHDPRTVHQGYAPVVRIQLVQ